MCVSVYMTSCDLLSGRLSYHIKFKTSTSVDWMSETECDEDLGALNGMIPQILHR